MMDGLSLSEEPSALAGRPNAEGSFMFRLLSPDGEESERRH
jgi:hypothetical protein